MWKLFVRGEGKNDISSFVKEIVFHLHKTFKRPTRSEYALNQLDIKSRYYDIQQNRRDVKLMAFWDITVNVIVDSLGRTQVPYMHYALWRVITKPLKYVQNPY